MLTAWLVACQLMDGGVDEDVNLTDNPPLPSSTAAEAPDCGPGVCLVPAADNIKLFYHRVAVDEDGVAWISWLDVIDSHITTLWVARSGGVDEPFGPLVAVPTAEPPIVSTSEKPDLAVSRSRIAVVYTGRGNLRHADAHAAYAQTGAIATDGTTTFDPAVLLDETEGTQWVVEQAHVALVSDAAWVLYKRQVYGEIDDPTIAVEADPYAIEPVSDELSHHHECSPPDLIPAVAETPATVTGAPPVAFAAIRSNVDGYLQTMVLASDADGFGSPVQVSNDSWAFSALVCPNDGPVLAQDGTGRLIALWTAQEDFVYRAFLTSSVDGGLTWSDAVPDHPDEGEAETNPTLTALPAGGLLTTVQILGETRAYYRDDIAAEPVPTTLTTPLGDPITDLEVATGGGRTVGLGTDADGRLWLIEL